MPTAHYSGVASALRGLATMAETGYYQLYFLFVIMQFYLVFPLLIAALRRTRGHHGLVLAATALAQLAILTVTQWNLLPSLMQHYNQVDALSYLLYLVAGCIVALHLEQVDAWVRGHARLIFTLTVVAALAAEGLYFLAQYGVTSALGSGYSTLAAGDSAFLPTLIPFNVGVIACGYLAGVALVRPGRSRLTRAVVRSGVDNAYGIYLSQLLVLLTLRWLGWGNLSSVIPWPLLCLLSVGIVIACCVPLTALLARTPLAAPLTGRRPVRWRGSGSRRPPEPLHSLVGQPEAAQPAGSGEREYRQGEGGEHRRGRMPQQRWVAQRANRRADQQADGCHRQAGRQGLRVRDRRRDVAEDASAGNARLRHLGIHCW
jgi:peptidoglycan/LPS O-acetylase OafA/YrhL